MGLNSLPADLFGGLEVAASRVPPIPIVILLAARSRSFAERARAAGAADVLFLPPDRLELQAEIEAVERRGHVIGAATLGAFEHLRETTLIGEDPRFRKCIEELIVAAQSQAHVLLRLGKQALGRRCSRRQFIFLARGPDTTIWRLIAPVCQDIC